MEKSKTFRGTSIHQRIRETIYKVYNFYGRITKIRKQVVTMWSMAQQAEGKEKKTLNTEDARGRESIREYTSIH